jgi:thiaminase/transcriptional activator TenA
MNGGKAMSFIGRIWDKTMEVVDEEVKHPHLQEMASGILPEEKFIFQAKQNYQYLLEYTRAASLGIAKSPDYETMVIFQGYVNEVLDHEIPFYRQYYREKFNIDVAELDNTIMANIKRSYTSHELARSWEGDLAALTISLLPCAICYNEVAKKLIKICNAPEGSFHRDWIQMYVGEIFTTAVENIKALTDKLTENKSENELKKLEEIYLVSCQYELLSWDMYYKMETWPMPHLFENL